MKIVFLVCAAYLHFGESYGLGNTNGVGAFAYNGPEGRYGGTYDLQNGDIVNQQGDFPPNFSPPTFPDLDDFFPDYFNNLENVLQEVTPFIRPSSFIRLSPFRRSFFKPSYKRTFDSVENQKLAYAAATKAFDLTTNRAASNIYFAPFRFPFGDNFGGFPRQGFPGQGFSGPDMSNFGRTGNSDNSAYAGAAIGPEFVHQVAEINPSNPNNPNIDKQSKISAQPGDTFKSVSTFSVVSSSSDSTGRRHDTRRAETTVNNNGVITKYKVEN